MSFKVTLVSSMGFAALMAAHPAFAQTVDSQGAGNSATVEDIMVTAQRTTQRLQDVPIAVSAISSEGLENRGIINAYSLGNAVPGLQITQTGTTTTPYLRGVGSNAANPNTEASVATYIDGIYIAAPYANALSFNNIDRVEVLKGPQGTLFGRNATGGVIQIITRTPKHEPSADVSVGYGNYNTVTTSGYLTGGLTDTIAMDVAVQYRNQKDGFGEDKITGAETYRSWEESIRSKLLFEPSDATTVTLAADYSNAFNSDLNYVFAPSTPTITGQDFYDTSADTPAKNRKKVWGGSADIRQDLGFATFVSLTSRRIARGLNNFDRDGTPLTIVTFNTPQEVKTWTQEFQLIGSAGSKLEWTTGAYYFNNNAAYNPARLIGLAFGPTPDSEIDILGRQKTKSYSAYAQATYEIVPRLKATGGIRYTHEKADIHWEVGGAALPDAETKFNRATWRTALDYEAVDDVHVYVSYNRGLKSGGFDLLSPGVTPYKPEVLDAYEAGLKSELFDKRVRLNMSAFFYDYKNIQVSANPTGGIITVNGPKAKVKGIDADVEFAVTENLRLNGGVGLIDSEFGDFPNPIVWDANGAPAPLANAKGNRIPRSPKFTGNLAATYDIPTSSGTFSLTGSYYHNSGFFWDVDNRLAENGYDLFGAAVKWTTPDGKYGVRLWGENLGDEHYQAQGVSGQGFGDTVAYGAPRTYGVTLTGNF